LTDDDRIELVKKDIPNQKTISAAAERDQD